MQQVFFESHIFPFVCVRSLCFFGVVCNDFFLNLYVGGAKIRPDTMKKQ